MHPVPSTGLSCVQMSVSVIVTEHDTLQCLLNKGRYRIRDDVNYMQQKIHQKYRNDATNDSKGDCPANMCANNIDFSVAISYRGVVGYLLYE